MNIQVKRIFLGETYTIGKLSIDGEYFCDTLEDTVRDPGVKIQDQTAIPYGTYKVILDFSIRFQRIMPHILDVPGFEGIRIHSGNTDKDTDGCILLGVNKIKGEVINSKVTFDKFFSIIQNQSDITITIS
jgi:hypothetical protein